MTTDEKIAGMQQVLEADDAKVHDAALAVKEAKARLVEVQDERSRHQADMIRLLREQ